MQRLRVSPTARICAPSSEPDTLSFSVDTPLGRDQRPVNNDDLPGCGLARKPPTHHRESADAVLAAPGNRPGAQRAYSSSARPGREQPPRTIPGEHPIAGYNLTLAVKLKHQREELLKATEERLKTIQKAVVAGLLKDVGNNGVRGGKTLAKTIWPSTSP